MPLARLPASVASQNLRRRRSLWPDGRVPTDRLNGVAQVGIDNSFTFDRSDRIMTIGSCFAREIEKRLQQFGFDLPMLDVTLSKEERASTVANDFANKYTAPSIGYEFAWAFNAAARPAPEDLFLEVEDGLWHDPHLIHNMQPAPLERVIERRAMVEDAYRQLPTCRIVVITLGLAEAWYDHRTGLHLNGAPPTPVLRRDPERFSLDLLAYEEILDALTAIHALVKQHGHPQVRMLVTVSPVPMKATFTGLDAIQANTYSKAVQRAAVEAFVRAHDDVDYFPSYEIATLSDRALAYERDNIHVTPVLVGQIIDRVLEKYAPSLDFTPQTLPQAKSKVVPTGSKIELKRTAKYLAAERRYDDANDAYEELSGRFAEKMDPEERGQLHLDYGVSLLRSERTVDGVYHLRQASALLPGSDRAAFKLGLALGRLKQVQGSIDALRRATELAPETSHYFARLGMSLDTVGQGQDARVAYRQALDLDPANPEAQAYFEALSPTAA